MTEGEIQKAVFAQLKSRPMPGVVAWHHPNHPSSRRKSGYLAGVADVCAVHLGKFYAIELKADGGRASDDQLKFRDNINGTEGYAVVAEGLDQAICILEEWGLLRKEVA